MAPGTWKWPTDVLPAAGRGLGLLPGVSGAEVVAATGVTAAAWWCCGLRSGIGWGLAG